MIDFNKNSDVLVSVIIPTFGRVDFLDDAIKSVVNQTYTNLEIIVCDDNAGNPKVRSEVKSIVDNYPEVRLIQNANNLGGALNRNVGIQRAKGELISFLDDDDVYLPERIEKVVDLYLKHKNEKIGIIYTHYKYTDAHLNIKGKCCIYPTDNPLYLHMCGCLCATSQWTVPSYVFDEVGLFEPSPSKQDSIMLLKILGKYNKALCVPECLSLYRAHSLNVRISNNCLKHIEGEKKYASFLKHYYHLLTKSQTDYVEACIAKRMLLDYSNLHEYKHVWQCLIVIIKKLGITGLGYRDLLFAIASPNFYGKIYRFFKSISLV